MKDILERLSEAKMTLADVEICSLLSDALLEIKRLRMAQTPGPSFREIKQSLKVDGDRCGGIGPRPLGPDGPREGSSNKIGC